MSTMADSIKDRIDESGGRSIVNGVSRIINSELELIIALGDESEQYSYSTSTFIERNELAMSVVRFDYAFWEPNVTAKSIKEEIKTMLVSVAYKSVVSLRQLMFDGFKIVYSLFVDLSAANIPTEVIKTTKEIYDLLGRRKRYSKE